MDISNLIGGTGVALEAAAYKQFGAAVQGQVEGQLASIFGNSNTPPPFDPANPTNVNVAPGAILSPTPGVWDPTPYADAFASGAGGFDPKTKFLFKIKIEFDQRAAQMAASYGIGVDLNSLLRDELSFVISDITLPKVDFEYQDVNMYNFRTQVLTRIKNGSLDLNLHDDIGNRAITFMNAYLALLKPITRRVPGDGMVLEDHGFAFSKVYSGLDTSYRGALPYGVGGNTPDSSRILSRITIEQYYVERGKTTPTASATKINSFIFTNPRVTRFDATNLDHSMGSESNKISVSFTYDSLHIDIGKVASAANGTPVFPGGKDLLSGVTPEALQYQKGLPQQQGKSENPFAAIISQQARRGVASIVSGALSKSPFGTIAGGALQGAIGTISGALGTQASNTLGTIGTGVAQQFRASPAPALIDSAASSVKGLVTQVTSKFEPEQAPT
jgi:hypothetical protein